MKLSELSAADQEIVLQLVLIAREECIDRTWDEVEPMLASYWNNGSHRRPEVRWVDIAPYVQARCDRPSS